MSLKADLATLRWAVERLLYAEGIAAVKRVEAEIARLEQDRDEAEKRAADSHEVMVRVYARAEAAEAEAARLRDGLRWYAERRNYVPAAPPAVPPPKHLMDTDAWDGGGPGARARALLAEEKE